MKGHLLKELQISLYDRGVKNLAPLRPGCSLWISWQLLNMVFERKKSTLTFFVNQHFN